MKRPTAFVLFVTHILPLLLLLSAFNACSTETKQPIATLMGTTMGTQWHIKLHPIPENKLAQLKHTLEQQLIAINNTFSTYQTDSAISRFNRFKSKEAFAVSAEFVTVINAAQSVSKASQGAFDITIAPLINLWGFGKAFKVSIPTDQQIETAKRTVGFQHLIVQTSPPALYKTIPSLHIDLSAIAKGYAVDQLATTLEQHGIQNYMVEIGGEIRLKGRNAYGNNWQIAIQKPDATQSEHTQQLISLAQTAIATSGDYYNYFEANGKRYSHTINPISGKPITHNLASVTVLHRSAMMADAYATALSVLGAEKGMALAEHLHLAVTMLIRDDKHFISKTSSHFPLENE
ncbi:MAG TPA: FAD:protein FMN transferase [Thiothrix sp.]|nr:FAD:protein FMN transferase [Thiothrix sp.]